MEYGLIGEHLPHSFSKEIHEKLGWYSYEIKELRPDEVAGFMTERNCVYWSSAQEPAVA